LRLPIWRSAQLTAFFTKLRSSTASRRMSGRNPRKTSSGKALNFASSMTVKSRSVICLPELSAMRASFWTSRSRSTSAATTLQTTGTNALQSLIADTNSTANGQYVFGGDTTGVAPIADYFSSTTSAAKSDIDAAFQSAFGFAPTSASASTISASDMQTFLSGAFANLFSGASWTTDWSSASNTDVTTQIAPGESATTSTNANQPGFQQLAEGYAMLAEFGGSSLSSATQQTVVTAATSLINQGISSLTTTEATLGVSQTRVTDANTSMSSQLTILQTQIGNLDNVDSQKIATQLSSLQTQLETAYQLTAQLQKMNLAQYLPT